MNRILHHTATVLVLAFAVLAVVAAKRTDLFDSGLWQPNFFSHFGPVLLIALGIAALVALARRRGWSRRVVAAGAVAALATWFAGPGAVATVVLALVSAFCLGRRLLPDDAFAESGMVAMAVALGLAGFALVLGVASFFPVASAGAYLLLMVAPIAWGFGRSRELLLAAWRAHPVDDLAHSRGTDALAVAIGTGLALQLLAVLQPEFGYDALHMHLTIVDHLRVLGRAEYDPTHFAWAVMPMDADWVFALVALPGGEAAARLLNFAAFGALLALLHDYVAARAGRFAGMLAVAMLVVTPLSYLESSSLLVETLWALWLVAALWCAGRTLDVGGWRWVFASGVLFGTAMATKVMAVFAAPFFVAVAIAWAWQRRPTLLRDLGVAAGGIALAGALPYVHAWIRTGNPVFPFFNQWFASPYAPTTAFDNPLYHQPLDWRLLYAMTFETGGFLEANNGAMGLLWLMLLPAAALLVWRAGTRHAVAFVLALVFVLGVFSSQTYLRYVYPMFALLAALVALALAHWRTGALERRLLGAVLGFGALAGLVLYVTATWEYRELRLPPGPDAKARRDFARGRVDERLVPAVLDALELRRVLWFGHPRFAGSDARVELLSWIAPANHAEYMAVATTSDARAYVARRGYEAIVLVPGDDPCRRPAFCAFLERDTSVAYSAGTVVVRRVHDDVLFDQQLLANPGFDPGVDGWEGESYAPAAPGRVVVDDTRVFYQGVAVTGGGLYRLDATAACVPAAPQAQLRLQVNFYGKGDKGLGTQGRLFDCARAGTASLRMHAPAGATMAVVYASANVAGQPVEIDRLSLWQ